MTQRQPRTAVEVSTGVLAVYRLTRLLQRDTLPPIAKARDALMARYGASPYSELLDCPWCLSVWLAGGWLALEATAPRLAATLRLVMASSAVAGVISQLVDHLDSDPEHADDHHGYPRWAGTEPQET